ncbi:MAG: hypothetical protein GY820_04690, partial [Gammaproteobacteria bacterium]|nr:hypothetical protein [Gammaproteobacteria bacterium]
MDDKVLLFLRKWLEMENKQEEVKEEKKEAEDEVMEEQESEEEGKDKETHTPWAVVPQKKKEKEIKEKSCDQE